MTILQIAAVISVLVWIYLTFFRGGFWRADQKLPVIPEELEQWPDVVAVIPARNESQSIGATVSSLLNQSYPGRLDIVVVDDNSTDGTGKIAREAAAGSEHLTVLPGKPLPAGWSGKLWAVHQGLQQANDIAPAAAFVLLTDADIEHEPESVRRLVGHAETGGLDLVSLMVRLKCRSFWERMMIPAFVYFFQKLYPFSWVNDPKRPEAAAAGGCMLVRRQALDRIGGVESIKDRLIDDCALAAAIKKHGPIWLGLTEDVVSLRDYTSLGEIWNMVARGAFEQLRYSWLMVLLTVLGMVLIYIVPAAAVLFADDPSVFLLGLGACVMMVLAFRRTLILYGQPWPWALLLPVTALFYTLMTVDSAIRHWRGKGGGWKDRHYGTGGQLG